MKGGFLIKIIFLIFIFLSLINSISASYFIDVIIPIEYLSVNAGDSISANVKIVKISKDTMREDYDIKARIIDGYGNILVEKNKVIAIENEVNTVVSFDIPENIEPGEYKIEIIVGENKSSSGFMVHKPTQGVNMYLIYITIGVLLIFILIFYYYNRKLNKLLKQINERVYLKNMIKKR